MAANRYGRIYHSNHHHINLRFPSVDARREFTEKFEKYHASHDHDGEAPRFEDITAQEAGSTTYESGKLHDAHSVTIDGYATYEIEEYHEDNKHTYYYRYKPPTCCVPPLISIDRKLVKSDELERHELSAIFGDMPDDDYDALLESVERDGFIDNVVRLYGGKILDGWHRYSAAEGLNLLRKLRFKQWHEDDHRDGDPRVFVYGRNLNRRHYSAAKRAQVAVAFNERFGIGMNQYSEGVPNGTPKPKTREQLAKEAGVGVRTIARAVEVEKEGQSEAVIAGEKTAGEVLLEKDRETAKQSETEMWEAFKVIAEKVRRDAFKRGACRHHTNWGVEDIPSIEDMKSPKVWASRFDLLNGEIRAQATWIKALVSEDTEVPPTQTENQKARAAATAKKRKRQVLKNMWDTRIQAARDYTGDSDTDLNLHLTLPELEKGFAKNNEAYAAAFESGMQRIDKAHSFNDFQDRAFEVDEFGVAKVDISELEEAYRAIMTYAGDIRQWEREDWSPDTNWILPLIEAKKAKSAPKPKPEPSEASHHDDSDRMTSEDLKTLREQVKAQMPKYKQWYKDSGYQESDLISRASFSQFIHVLRESRETAEAHHHDDSDRATSAEQDGAATLEELKDLLDTLKRKSYPFAHKLRQIVRPKHQQPGPAAADDEPDDRRLNDRMDRCRADLLEVWQQQVHTWEGLEIQLYVEAYGLSADIIAVMQREIAAEHPRDHDHRDGVLPTKPEATSPTAAGCEVIDEPSEDTSLAEIDNLPAVKHFLESLLKQVGTVEHQGTRDDSSVCVFDALMVDSELTEREQLSILIDCAHSLVAESM